MNVKKCDLCKKTIKRDNHIVAGTGSFRVMELCYNCGAPIAAFLKQHKFIKKEEKYGSKKGKK
jgi:ribosome-binding protein aMBF1 (putative translation factor)